MSSQGATDRTRARPTSTSRSQTDHAVTIHHVFQVFSSTFAERLGPVCLRQMKLGPGELLVPRTAWTSFAPDQTSRYRRSP